MSKYRQGFYVIDLVKEGFCEETDLVTTPVYNILRGKFGYIPKNIDYDNPPVQLVEDGFIVPSTMDEAQQYKQNQIKTLQDEYPKQLMLEICPTMKCNYNCSYCFEKNKTVDMTEEVLKDTLAYIKREIDNNQNLQSVNIKWFGGEPTLPQSLKIIHKISKYVMMWCKERNLKYTASMISNGYNLTKDVTEELFNLKVQLIQVALDGFEDTYNQLRVAPKDAYQRVLDNIEQSVVPIVIRLNTTRNNKDEIIELAKSLSALSSIKSGKNRLVVSRVKEYVKPLQYGFTDREWLALREDYIELKDYMSVEHIFELGKCRLCPCSRLQLKSVALCADGYIYRCDNHLGNKTLAIGTIKKGITKNNSIDKEFVCSTITGNCLKCKYLPICAGGLCRYAELKRGKDCELVKGRFKQNMTNYLKYVYKTDS